MNLEAILSRFERSLLPLKAVPYEKTGIHAEALLEKNELRKAVQILYDEKFYLVFLTAVSMKPASCMVYQFAHHDTLLRLELKFFAENNEAPTISYIFHGANWHEREVHDFFGITFTNHPDMRPLILSELDEGFHPLLKKDAALLDAETLGFLPAKPEEPEAEKAEEAAPEESTANEGSPE